MSEATDTQPSSEPSPNDLHIQATKLEASGSVDEATDAYIKSGHIFKALQLQEQEGNYQKAYEIATQSNDRYSANRLASEHSIEGHEFTDFPPLRGRDFNEVMTEALISRLKPGKTAEKLGFGGFEEKVVVDVGSRDGRFVPMFEELGAKEVYGVDPDATELAKAVKSGLLDEEHAVTSTLREAIRKAESAFGQEADMPHMPRVDVATVFNFNIPIANRDEFILDLWFALKKDGGQALITVAAADVAFDIAPRLQKNGFSVLQQRLWDETNDGPHAYLLVCSKIPNKHFASFSYGGARREG